MMNLKQFRERVLRDTLIPLNLHNNVVEELLLATALHESDGFRYIVQVNGPALGFYQVEPATHADLWENFLRYHPKLVIEMDKLLTMPVDTAGNIVRPAHARLIFDMAYATVIARLVYFRKKDPLPTTTDIAVLAEYWKKHYNTIKGRGTVEAFVASYNKHMEGR